MKTFKKILHKIFISKRKEIPFIIFFFFLVSFSCARLVAYMIHADIVPDFLPFIGNVYIRGHHIHHFNFGIWIVILAGFISLIDSARAHARKAAVLFGAGLGLIMDEFGMLITLEDVYWTTRMGYDAVIVTSLILLNIVYFGRFWKIMGATLKKFLLFRYLFKM